MISKQNSNNKSITIGDIAKELGVSKTTISRAISGKGRIGEETKRRVLEYIDAHDYRPNLIAKSLAESKTFNIGVCMPGDTEFAQIPFFQGCLMGICEAAAGLDYDVVVTTTTEDDINYLKRIIHNNKVDGVILTRTLLNDMAQNYLKQMDIPFVVIGTSEDEDVIQVDSDHRTGCAELTSVLLMAGNINIALLSGNEHHTVNQNRCKGFMDALEKTKTVFDSRNLITNLNSNILIDRAVDRVLERGITCIVCSDDNICTRVLARLEEMNYQIPKDIKVASFYNSVYLESHNPPVTAMNIAVKELGITAGKAVIELTEGKEIKEKTYVNYELLLKKSTM